MKKLIIIALVVSIITGIAIFQFTSALQRGSAQKMEPVVFAVNTIPEGTVLMPDMVTIKEVPVDYVHVLAFNNIDDVVGRITKDNIEADEQVLTSRLSDVNQENNDLSYTIDPNYRALTIITDEEKGVAGYLVKGDRVDLVATIPTKDGITSQIIVENIEILEIGSNAANGKGEEYISVTVSVPINEVTKVQYALSPSDPKYRLVLRSPVDAGTVGTQNFTP